MSNLIEDTQRCQDFDKESRINTELERLTKFFEEVDENQKAMALPLLQNAAFMKVTLEDLQKIINKEGATDQYKNGANQHGTKQSAALQSYNTVVKNYASVIKSLSQLVPPVKKESHGQDLKPHVKTAAELETERKRLAEEGERWSKEARRLLHG